MKKMFIFGIAVGAILALGAMAFGVYTATNASAANPSPTSLMTTVFGNGRGNMFHGPDMGDGTHGDGPLQPYIEEAVAKILGISVEELQAAKDNGTRTSELVDAAGLTMDEFRTALEAALPGIVEQAVADGAITQEQANLMLERGLRRFGHGGGPGEHGGGVSGFGLRGDGVLQPYMEAAVAKALGMTVEDLQAAKDEGTRMSELLDNAGLTAEEFQAAMETALPGILEQALKDGVITQAQADYILENGLRSAKRYLRSVIQEYVDAAVADILGVTVEELQTARKEGTLADLLAAAGLTSDELQTALNEATPGIVEQALEEGLITQAQADYLLENGLHFFQRHDGRGGHGPHGDGFGGPGGFGPSNQNKAPTTDSSAENG